MPQGPHPFDWSDNHALIAAGGIENDPDGLLPQIGSFRWSIAADGGYRLLEQLNLPCSFLIGDFDTLHPQEVEAAEKKGAETHRHPRNKAKSDLELALDKAFELGAKTITLIGALGGQWDHCVTNIVTPLSLCGERGAWGRLLTSQAQIYLADCSVVVECPGSRVSLVSLSREVAPLTLKGFEYSLEKARLKRTQTLGLANRAVAARAYAEFDRGELLVTVQRGSE